MGIAIIRGTNDKPGASNILAEAVDQWANVGDDHSAESGKLYIGHPVIATPDGPRRIDALLASETHGLVAFDLVEHDDIAGHQERQDDFANAIEAKLRTQRNLVRRENGQRKLVVPVHSVSFAPAVANPPDAADYPVLNTSTLAAFLDNLDGSVFEPDAFALALSLLESMSAIRRPHGDRPPATPQSRGAKLRTLERAVATLDTQQAQAVIETADGVQRLRGLAGSGKTIVLAQKAAYLHARHPDWRIAVTFYTRSLKEYFRDLITKFFVSQTTELPNWDKLWIAHAWGGRGGPEHSGMYRHFCNTNDATYLNFTEAKFLAGPSAAFQEACRRALKEVEAPKPSFDSILIDEAQDLPPEFLAICYRSLTEEKRLVYAYDELQNLNSASVKAPRDIFGPDVRWDEEAPQSDVVLHRCYRNPRPVLTTAHALGFGIHRTPSGDDKSGIVQMFDDVRMWKDVGYEASGGTIREGAAVTLRRTDATSPRFLEDHSPLDDLVMFKVFADAAEQDDWLVRQICKNLLHDAILPEDIIVIHPDPSSTLRATASMRARLLEREVKNHLAGANTMADEFRRIGSVTFTGIHRAKGHEAGMVYVVNAQRCYSADHGLARLRNMLFAAITRSKAWVRVCGIGDRMTQLAREYTALKNDGYKLRFRYPTKEELETIRIVHRDKLDDEATLIDSHTTNLRRFLDDLENKQIYLEDIAELQPTLRQVLAVRERGRQRGNDVAW